MDLLKIDTGLLDRTQDALLEVHDLLEDSAVQAEQIAEHVGHDGLADRARRFANAWDQRRKELLENIETLRADLATGSEAFETTDGDLAASLEGGQMTPIATRPEGGPVAV